MLMSAPMLFLLLFVVHVALGVLAYVERRLKPLYALLQVRRFDTQAMVELARHYRRIGVDVPSKLLVEPGSVVSDMLRKLEARVSLEVTAVLFVALIPSSALTVLLI